MAHHIYSFKELEALQKGGVHRIYTGNVATGEHQLEVSVAGKLPGGKDFGASRTFRFRKDVEPKLVGITLAGGDSCTRRTPAFSAIGPSMCTIDSVIVSSATSERCEGARRA